MSQPSWVKFCEVNSGTLSAVASCQARHLSGLLVVEFGVAEIGSGPVTDEHGKQGRYNRALTGQSRFAVGWGTGSITRIFPKTILVAASPGESKVISVSAFNSGFPSAKI